MLPFSRDAFFAVFASYNVAVWPAQVFLYGLALVLLALALRGRSGAHRAISLGLGLLWLWTVIVYHWWHFAAINPPAWAFGALFVLQGAIFVGHGIGGHRLRIGRLGAVAAGSAGSSRRVQSGAGPAQAVRHRQAESPPGGSSGPPRAPHARLDGPTSVP